MREIRIINKVLVSDICVSEGLAYPTNLMAYDIILHVDDQVISRAILSMNLSKNAKKVGFSDDYRTFVRYADRLDYISFSTGVQSKFLREWWYKWKLDNCMLRIVCENKVFNYPATIII